MAANQKCPPLRDPLYLAWIRSMPSVQSGKYGCVAHHMVGHGRLSTQKSSDYFAIPMTDAEHRVLHDHGWPAWEEKHGSQLEHAARMMEQAIRQEVLVLDPKVAKGIASYGRD